MTPDDLALVPTVRGLFTTRNVLIGLYFLRVINCDRSEILHRDVRRQTQPIGAPAVEIIAILVRAIHGILLREPDIEK